MKKFLGYFVLFCMSCGFIGFYFLNQKHEIKATKQVQFSVSKPWRQSFETQDEYVAQIKSIQHIDIRSFEKGFIDKIHVKEGQYVVKNQPMFQLMPKLFEAELKKSKAEYDLSRIKYQNTESLYKNKVVSVNELALAKARLDKVDADLNLVKTHLDFATIKAPFNGIIDRFRVRLGSLVDEGDLLTTLSDNTQMWVYFNVSEAKYLDLMAKKTDIHKIPIALRQANGQTFPQEGFIDTIEADFNNKTGNVAFRATFANPEGILRHGETGTILLTQKFDDALVIPQKATFEVLDKVFVYLVDADGTLRSKQITIEKEIPHLYVIRSGLKSDDTVLLEGLGKVHSGKKIAFQYQTVEQVQKSLKLSVD
jgi:membrane fusion protein (multidrug efflux system)